MYMYTGLINESRSYRQFQKLSKFGFHSLYSKKNASCYTAGIRTNSLSIELFLTLTLAGVIARTVEC